MFRLSSDDVEQLKREIGVASFEELASAFHCVVGYPLNAKYMRDQLANFGELTLAYSRDLAALSIIIQQQRLLPPEQHVRPVLI